MTDPGVPSADLHLAHLRIEAEVRAGFDRVLADSSFILGPEVETFERAFARYCEVDHVIGVANGTDAIELALRSAGIGKGDEVIVPANTFVATAEAVVRSGASVVFADCDDHFLLDVDDLPRVLSERTAAVIGVHLYGQCAPMEEIRRIVGPEVLLLEDAAQAQGARRFGARAGSLGDIAATSFYPGKNLGAYGDAGAVMTPRADLAKNTRDLRNHGGTARYEHRMLGLNSRLDGLQAVVLNAKLAVLDDWNEERRVAAALYDALLTDVADVTTPLTLPGNEHVYHLYVVRVPNRDEVHEQLTANGIATAIHYPRPVHLLEPFLPEQGMPRVLPRSEQQSAEILSLPIFPGITPQQQTRVVDGLSEALSSTTTMKKEALR
ncbi:MAG: erythromycin biosynthesis sensory transduction protein eryC1 [Subtercola sp.]|nr:erythromycin biosynthesis sensory transduction protein eryC1 [Subtercola sp.]